MSLLTASKIECADYTIHFNNWENLSNHINNNNYSKVVCIVDDNTHQHCLPILEQKIHAQVSVIIINAGEKSKTIDTCSKIWEEMMHLKIDRHSLVINLGGGVVGDMGGFCAATYVRGVAFILIPTTLLSQVDSSVGGKLGVDHNSYKNMIGLIKNPEAVYIFPEFLSSLPNREVFSGFAEMIKHALISDKNLWSEMKSINPLTHSAWMKDIQKSVIVKHAITEIDPLEKSIRKQLNFGHTIGHAIESENLNSEHSLLHGEAIAIGIICESHISYQKELIDESVLTDITDSILNIYARHPGAVSGIEDIISRTKHDKKNKGALVRCTLLASIGEALIDQEISENEIRNALSYYCEV